MPTVKTAISIDKKLFDKADKLAKKAHMSRSQLYSQALEHLVASNDNTNLVKELNKAYGSGLTEEEKMFVKLSTENMARIVDKW